jgi:hypothetical protein
MEHATHGLNRCRRKPAIRLRACNALLWFTISSSYAAAQADSPAAVCPSPEAVLQRYVDAIGGETAIAQIETRVAETKATIISPGPVPLGPLPSSPTTHLTFRWKSPNKVTVTGHSSVDLFTGGKTTWRFDGKLWYSPSGRNSRENASHGEMEYEVNMMYRLAADPLIITRARTFYSSFEAADRSPAHPEFCVLRAHRLDTKIFAFESSSSCSDCLAPPADTPFRRALL